MYLYRIILLCVLRAVFVSASIVPNFGVDGCLGCGPGDRQNGEMEEFLKTQKIAQRLQSIKKQLDNNLRIKRQPKNAPKLEALPQFLIDQLMYSIGNDGDEESRNVDTVETKQVVLFPEEVISSCHPKYKSSVCLKFRLTDDILVANISSAKLWFNKEQFSTNKAKGQNFTIIEGSLNTEIPNKLSNTSRIFENDGWYQKEITSTVRLWMDDEIPTTRTISILCSTCDRISNSWRRTSNNRTASGPFLLLNTETEKSTRSKRGVDCHPGNSNNECCRESLEIDLRQIEGYEMVYHPLTFNAYVCRGNCYIYSAVNAGSPYGTLLSKLKLNDNSKYVLPASCCTPNRFSSLPVFYASSNRTLEKIIIPNMIVESCGCI